MPLERGAAVPSRQHEANYETNLDWEKTLNNLGEDQVMKIVEPGPPAIRHLYWKNVFCSFGRNGGLNIHSPSEEETNEFVLLLRSAGVYHDAEDPRWILKRSTHGKQWYKSQLIEYKSRLQDYKARLQHKP